MVARAAVGQARILELYLNVIEYGPAIYGMRNAALALLRHACPSTSRRPRAAFLATDLAEPQGVRRAVREGQPSALDQDARWPAFLQHMHARERIDDEALAYGLEELEQLSLLRPDQAAAAARLVRGTAQAPPFDSAAVPVRRVGARAAGLAARGLVRPMTRRVIGRE